MDPALLAAPLALLVAGPPIALRASRWGIRRRKLRTVEGLAELHPTRFERTVGGWLARAGWLVEQRGGTGDGGIDLLAFRDGRVLAVQCKCYRPDRAVAATALRDLFGAATAMGATSAYLVTTGRVSAPALEWAAGIPPGPTGLVVVNGETLAAIAADRRWDP